MPVTRSQSHFFWKGAKVPRNRVDHRFARHSTNAAIVRVKRRVEHVPERLALGSAVHRKIGTDVVVIAPLVQRGQRPAVSLYALH